MYIFKLNSAKNMSNKLNQSLILTALKIPRVTKIFLAISLDSILSMFAAWMALSFQLGKFVTNFDYFTIALLSIGLAIPILYFFGFYKSILRYVSLSALGVLAKAITTYTSVFIIFILLLKFENIPRSIGLMQPMILFILIIYSRWLIKIWLSEFVKTSFPKKIKKEVIIYGAGSAGRQLASGLAHSNEFKFLYFIDDNKNFWGGTIDGFNVKSPLTIKSINPNAVKELWLAMPKLSHFEKRRLINKLQGKQLHVRTLPTFSDLVDGKVRINDLRELDINELLGREKVKPNISLLNKCIFQKTVLVTGAGGSIGSEICRQILSQKPKYILLLESSEIALYNIQSELLAITNEQKINNKTILIPLLANVLDDYRLEHIFKVWKPQTVYHAAAYKHVPIVEHNVVSGIKNNVVGTLKCANIAIKYKTNHFVLISTDKAVRPTNVMGASKRLAEISLQLLNSDPKNKNTRLCMVRFGNVLGSSGSVAPLFEKQIESGGPITLTHKKVTRYFMTVTEAAQLVIQAGAMSKGGEVFVLDMGKPIHILKLAYKMIEAKGLLVKDKQNPFGDIEIKVKGLRHGEKLYEELLIGNNAKTTLHPRILQAYEKFIEMKDFQILMKKLNISFNKNNVEEIIKLLKKYIPEYTPSKQHVDWVLNYKKN